MENQKGLPLPPLQDSFPDAGEAINDFWSMSGNFIYHHHVEPRVKLYSPSEESFTSPLKYIDVSRTTRTNLDVMQESRIDDYWKTKDQEICLINGKRHPDPRPDHLWPELWTELGRNAKLREKQKWSNETLELDSARRLRGMYFIDPEDKEFKETMRNAGKKLETPNGSRYSLQDMQEKLERRDP